MDDSILIAKLRKGDDNAFKYIYEKHYSLLCGFAFQLLRDGYRAEEVVDDAIFYLWQHHSELEIYSLRSYLMRSVRNRCLNELNSATHKREQNFSSFSLPENLDFLETVFIEGRYPLGDLLDRELEQQLESCIKKMPKECGRVFMLSRYEQKSYEEISKELNISVNTVKYHIKNALAFLRVNMKDYLKLLVVYAFI